MNNAKDSLRFLSVSDIQGNLHSLQELYDNEIEKQNPVDFIVHTGNFGFWNDSTIEMYHDVQYLKQIVAFLELLDKTTVNELNDLSTVEMKNANPMDELNIFRQKLKESKKSISQLEDYMNGGFKLPCPVYTIYGPLDDPQIIDKFQSGEYHIPNLHLIDHTRYYEIPSPLESQPNIKLYGLGGNLKIHSLFDSGNFHFNSISGKIGDLWITLIQIAELYINFMNFGNKKTINIFLSHAPVIKTPLLEHLAILTNADFTISQGLHFRYPVMGNGMSFVDSMGGSAGYIENYRSKFSRLRMILGEYWLAIKPDLNALLQETNEFERENITKLIEMGLSLFDKIPISINDSIDKIIPLTLTDPVAEDTGTSKKILKKINDYYFSAYYNLWHFNLCDHVINSNESDYNIMIFKLNSHGNFKLDYCTSQGFNFNFKLQEGYGENGEVEEDYDAEYEDPVNSFDAIEYSPKTGIKKAIVINKSKNEENGDAEDNNESDYEYNNDYIEDDNDDDDERRKRSTFRGRRGRGRGRGRPFRSRMRGRGRP